jgi:hypothetical protein
MLDPTLAHMHDSKSWDGSVGRGARVVRDRQGALRAATDRATGAPPVAAARCLVSVYNGGNMPSQPNSVFLTHPVDLDGAEVEGGAASPNVDTSGTIPVVVLWNAPQVGDLLVASAVGGRWVATRDGCQTTICVTACSSIPVYAAVVEVLSGSTVVASCTTSSTGCCTFSLCGTFTVQVTVGGTLEYSATRTLSSGGTTIISLGNNGLVCCGSYAIPQVLTLTDAAGSLSFEYCPSCSATYPTWTGGHSVQQTSSTVTTPGGACVVASPTTGPVRVCYQMVCNSSSNPVFTVQRSWSWVYQQGTLTPIWYQNPAGFSPGQLCITSPPSSCGSPLIDTASFAANPSSSSPFTLSGTPAVAPSNATSDPVGGSVAISV